LRQVKSGVMTSQTWCCGFANAHITLYNRIFEGDGRPECIQSPSRFDVFFPMAGEFQLSSHLQCGGPNLWLCPGNLGIRSSSKMSRRIWDLMYKFNYKIKQGIVNGYTMIYIYDYNTINTLETVHLHPFAIQFTFMYILVLGNKRHFRTLNAFGFVCNRIALQFQRFLIRFQV
jgi:hypothetical protein